MDFADLFFSEEEPEAEPEYPFVDILGYHIRRSNKHDSLWGELIWTSGRIVGELIKGKKDGFSVESKRVLEFGSGTGLTSICAADSGATKVVATDYPEQKLIDNLKFNTDKYDNISVVPHKWGDDVLPIIQANDGEKFDVVIMSDLVFNFSSHKSLLTSCRSCMKEGGIGILAFTHHRPHLVDKDMNFITMAKDEFDFKAEEVLTIKHPPMFENDPGDVDIRSTCHVWLMYG